MGWRDILFDGSASVEEDSSEYDEIIKEADECIDEDEFDKAIQLFEKAILLDPDTWYPKYMICSIKTEVGDEDEQKEANNGFDELISEFEEYLDDDDLEEDEEEEAVNLLLTFYMGKAGVLLKLEDVKNAEKTLLYVYENDEDEKHPICIFHLARIEFSKQKYKNSLKYLKEYEKNIISSDVEDKNLIGFNILKAKISNYYKLKDEIKFNELLTEAIKKVSKQKNIYTEELFGLIDDLIVILIEKKDYTNAQNILNKGIKIFSNKEEEPLDLLIKSISHLYQAMIYMDNYPQNALMSFMEYKSSNEEFYNKNKGVFESKTFSDFWKNESPEMEKLGTSLITLDFELHLGPGIKANGSGEPINSFVDNNIKNLQKTATNDDINDTKNACPKCSSSIEDGQKFCFECGHNLQQKDKCSSCGCELKGKYKFCPECGNKL